MDPIRYRKVKQIEGDDKYEVEGSLLSRQEFEDYGRNLAQYGGSFREMESSIDDDLNDLKKLTLELMQTSNISEFKKNNEQLINKVYQNENYSSEKNIEIVNVENDKSIEENKDFEDKFDYIQEVKAIESLSIQEKELELIKKSLEKHAGKRKLAAEELGISERTLYRKIKQFDL